jgi:tetratricopeptide (TPR) repeat protein
MTPYVYFLSDMRVVTGSSLGLPLALALSMLIKGEKPPENLIATGAVNDSGSVCSVAHVEDKISYAASSGFKIALVPESSRIQKLPENFELQKVSTLQEARLFASLHRPGNARHLSVFSALVRDPDGFIGASQSADPEWLRWIALERPEAISGDKLVSSVARATSLVNVLEKFVKEEEFDRAEPIAGLVDQNHLPLMEKHSPASAFKWCVLNMAIANHRGMINEARTWNAHAELIVGKTPITDFEWAVGCYNHMFVGFCHNLYCFIPDLPDYVGHVLEVVEGVYKSQLEFAPAKIAAYRPLGELCGSIAQNFGFCGPDQLEHLEIFIKKAMDAFGAGKIPDLREDWRRQFNYLAYAYLDAENRQKAEKALCSYLEISSLADLPIKPAKLGRWEHAVLARFFADTGLHTAAADYYYRKAFNLAPTIVEKRHPWQLWLNNMARLAVDKGNLTQAAAWHRQSLDLCISNSSGPTIKMMAMLALAGLYKIGRLDKEDMVQAKDAIKKTLNIVDRNHFSDLINAEFDAMPAIVAAAPNTYFPFSYR